MVNSFTSPNSNSRWQFWIDRGGTFTDIIGLGSDGSLRTAKLLSDNPRQYADAAAAGIRKLLDLKDEEPIPVDTIDCIKIGTTVATNALLERKVEPTVLVTNSGFGDCLRIAYQNRPDIFAKRIILPEQLYSHVVEVDCRIDRNGQELQALDTEKARAQFQTAYDLGYSSCAIVLMHSYQYPAQELALEKIAAEVGFKQISVSHQISPFIKIVSRGDTCVADACLSPVLSRYIEKVAKELSGVRLLFMQSNGGLAQPDHFRGKDSLLSGPAGGVVGARAVGKAAGCDKIIAFDMGGTSTDVSHIAGDFERTNDAIVSGVRIKAPMIAINTVAAGGGSICTFENLRMRVGPRSAGANPGPACYGNGGPLTITDCNLFLGRIQKEYFPKVFGPEGNAGLDRSPVELLLNEICRKVAQNGSPMPPEAVAQGFLSIAVTKMASAIKQISIEKGHDLDDYSLVSFGGAGGQHACKIADALGIKTILIHPLAGVLSAYGIGTANITRIHEESIERNLQQSELHFAEEALERLTEKCTKELQAQMVGSEKVSVNMHLALRYAGTDSAISVKFQSSHEMVESFEKIHKDRFGFVSREKQIIIERASVTAEAAMEQPQVSMKSHSDRAAELSNCDVYVDGSWKRIPLRVSSDLTPSQRIDGPALLADSMSTTFIEAGWQATVDHSGLLTLRRTEKLSAADTTSNDVEKPDPTSLELFNHIFMSIAEQMGTALQNTSQSINIKERLDFSCAIFDARGNLVANAPHIPVHLGSMSACVQQIIEKRGLQIQKGDVYVSNNPYAGGTHLPDITVVSPVFVGADRASFFMAARGHHADIGGITPGSMPANSRTLDDEGVVIDNFLLVRNDEFFESALVDLLSSSRHPARNITQNVADLKAQIAANMRGERALLALCHKYGLSKVERYMRFVQENSTAAVKTALALLQDGEFECTMDDGAVIKVSFRINRTNLTATIDFTGTSQQLSSNMNAPKSISNAACMYVLRTLIADDIPLNEGFLTPLTIEIPQNCLLNPAYPAAIVAGNVETSQQITDALYGALGVMAASQGTMNNFTFGNEQVQYYETICGGSGAGPSFDGTSAVQTNMTNSRLTDPEILELRFPVILEKFSIRPNSGGTGIHRGGDGVERRIKFLEPVTASILSQRRSVPPFGLRGGSSGASGKNYVIRRSGERIDLTGTATVAMDAGDIFVIETPGGGGYGAAD